MADALKLPEPKLWTLGAPADGKVLTGIKPTAGGGVPVFTAGQVADAILAERERCARAVPTSWLDPLMVMRVPAGCPEIEALCRRIAEAIRDGNAGVGAIDTADHVKHGPTGETWVVARVHGEHLHPCGWPPTRADLKDCTLVKKATPSEREKLLRGLSQGQTEHAGWAADALGVEARDAS